MEKASLFLPVEKPLDRLLKVEGKILDLERQWREYANVERQTDIKIVNLIKLAKNEADASEEAFKAGNWRVQLSHNKRLDELVRLLDHFYRKETAEIKTEINRMKSQLILIKKEEAELNRLKKGK